MKKCNICNYNVEPILIELTDANSTVVYCPNCLVKAYCDDTLSLTNSDAITDDITEKPGAITYKSNDEIYNLEKKTMLKLISYNLNPREYQALCEKYSPSNYMLHDDFYTNDGIAIQPIER